MYCIRLETAHKWLLHPAADPSTRIEGQKAINSIVSQGQRVRTDHNLQKRNSSYLIHYEEKQKFRRLSLKIFKKRHLKEGSSCE